MLLSHTQLCTAAQTSMHVSTHARAPAGVRWASPRLRLHLEVLPVRGHRKLVQSPASRLPVITHSWQTLGSLCTPKPRPDNYTRSNCCCSGLLGMLVIRDCSRSPSLNCVCSRAVTCRGCGVFGGCAHLKALIQWVAASSGGIGIKYFPFDLVRIFPVFAIARVLVIAVNAVF